MALSAEVLSPLPSAKTPLYRKHAIGEEGTNYLEKPRQLAEGVWLVGGEHQHRSTANSYLVRANNSYVLIDPGSEERFPFLENNLQRAGVPMQHIAAILATHAHLDHTGAIQLLQRRGVRVPVYVPEKSVPYIEHADPHRTASYLYEKPFLPFPYYQSVKDGEALTIGSSTFQFLSTPGHSPDSTSIQIRDVQRNVVFCGDGLWGSQSEEIDSDTEEGKKSLNKLIQLEANAYLPGHADLAFRPHTVATLQRAYDMYGKRLTPSFGNMLSPWA